jgi:hypothetical protein
MKKYFILIVFALISGCASQPPGQGASTAYAATIAGNAASLLERVAQLKAGAKIDLQKLQLDAELLQQKLNAFNALVAPIVNDVAVVGEITTTALGYPEISALIKLANTAIQKANSVIQLSGKITVLP